jgi:hypothetical protein
MSLSSFTSVNAANKFRGACSAGTIAASIDDVVAIVADIAPIVAAADIAPVVVVAAADIAPVVVVAAVFICIEPSSDEESVCVETDAVTFAPDTATELSGDPSRSSSDPEDNHVDARCATRRTMDCPACEIGDNVNATARIKRRGGDKDDGDRWRT